MAAEERMSPGDSKTVTGGTVTIKVEAPDSAARSAGRRLLAAILIASLMFNVMMLLRSDSFSGTSPGSVQQTYHSGSETAEDRIAVIDFSGTIMPPFTERWLSHIEQASEDDSVKAVLLSVDSPGGLVADSHQLYHELQKLREKKPVYVAMKRLAASGGYYIAMGIGDKGKIFAEPTTWTGSIGVIIPRYNAAELATKFGVKVEPLATGPMKDSLNPFRDLSDDERKVWDAILDDSFSRFVSVIEQNRAGLDEQQVRDLATGQIYTADQAVENGLVDHIGYEEDALNALATAAGLSDYQVIEYSSAQTLMELLLSSKADTESNVLLNLLEAGVPKAMYYCSWNPWVPTR